MNKKLYILLTIILLAVCGSGASAQGLLDTSLPGKFVVIGVRAGITRSNVTPNYDRIFSDVQMMNSDWRNGFNLGVAVDLNLRRYFSIQSGLYFANKSYDGQLSTMNLETAYYASVSRHSRCYYFQVPVLASFKFNLLPSLKLVADAGIYYAMGLGGNTTMLQLSNENPNSSELHMTEYKYSYFGSGTIKYLQMHHSDFGCKLGLGFKIAGRYGIYAHYLGGFKNIACQNKGYEGKATARNKEWSFTLGYDF